MGCRQDEAAQRPLSFLVYDGFVEWLFSVRQSKCIAWLVVQSQRLRLSTT